MRVIDRLYLVRWEIMITFAAYYQEPLREVATCNNKQGAKAISQTFWKNVVYLL